ncbi:hypothetical protein M0804_002671 [Polistes exclamans]|nr:hypothetical protein M0804_002671 [Polistes exclamans]
MKTFRYKSPRGSNSHHSLYVIAFITRTCQEFKSLDVEETTSSSRLLQKPEEINYNSVNLPRYYAEKAFLVAVVNAFAGTAAAAAAAGTAGAGGAGATNVWKGKIYERKGKGGDIIPIRKFWSSNYVGLVVVVVVVVLNENEASAAVAASASASAGALLRATAINRITKNNEAYR